MPTFDAGVCHTFPDSKEFIPERYAHSQSCHTGSRPSRRASWMLSGMPVVPRRCLISVMRALTVVGCMREFPREHGYFFPSALPLSTSICRGDRPTCRGRLSAVARRPNACVESRRPRAWSARSPKSRMEGGAKPSADAPRAQSGFPARHARSVSAAVLPLKVAERTARGDLRSSPDCNCVGGPEHDGSVMRDAKWSSPQGSTRRNRPKMPAWQVSNY